MDLASKNITFKFSRKYVNTGTLPQACWKKREKGKEREGRGEEKKTVRIHVTVQKRKRRAPIREYMISYQEN